MNRLVIFLFILFSCGEKNTDLNIIDFSPSFDFPIHVISIVDDSTAYFTGGDIWAKGFMGKSTNGGQSWNIDSISNKMQFGMDISAERGSAAGIDGRHYELEGNTWTEKNTSRSDIIKGIEVIGDKTIAVGGHAYQSGVIHLISRNGLVTNVYEGPNELNAVFAINDEKMFAAGFGTLLRTDDGGNSWELQDIQGDFFKDIFFVDQSTGYLIGYAGLILKTIDGGVQWSETRGAGFTFGPDGLQACHFLDKDHGWVVGKAGLILYTQDGGMSWEEFHLDNEVDLLDITSWDNRIFAVGGQGSIFQISL